MERDRKAEKVSVKQQEMLLNYMEAYNALAKNNIHMLVGGSEKARKLWDKLAENLNSVGTGSNKSGDRWRKYWTDWKFKVKRRHAEDKRLRMKAGGGPSKHTLLTETDLFIIKILGKEHTERDQDQDLRFTAPPSRVPPHQRLSPLEPCKPGAASVTGAYEALPASQSRTHPRHSPPRGQSRDKASKQPHLDVEPVTRAWLRRIEERRVEAELITAQAMREQTRIQRRLVDLVEEHLPQLSTAFTRIAAALEQVAPPVMKVKRAY